MTRLVELLIAINAALGIAGFLGRRKVRKVIDRWFGEAKKRVEPPVQPAPTRSKNSLKLRLLGAKPAEPQREDEDRADGSLK